MRYCSAVASERRIRSGPIADKRHAFKTLDALRGVAAVAVLTGHLSSSFGGTIFPHAYLGVDFFFLLSGFILAYSYQQKLDCGLPTKDFMWRRIIRLYPFYVMGVTLSLCSITIGLLIKHNTSHFAKEVMIPGICASLFIPVIQSISVSGVLLYPLNPPTWSLFYELLANMFHALAGRRKGTRVLLSLVLFSGLFLIWSACKYKGLDVGTFTSDVPTALDRVMFSYCSGLLVFRLMGGLQKRFRISPILPCLIFIVILKTPLLGVWNGLFDSVCCCLMFPMVLGAGALTVESVVLMPLFQFLGTISYGLYILHMPMFGYFARGWATMFHKTVSMSAPLSGVFYLSTLSVLVWILDRYYDVPLRKRIRLIGRFSNK